MLQRKINFRIEYHTEWGESLVLEYETGQGGSSRTPMEYSGGDVWAASLETSPETESLRWRYAVVRDETTVRLEEGGWRRFPLRGAAAVVEISDVWCVEPSVEKPFLHSAFSENIFSSDGSCDMVETCHEGMVTLVVGSIPLPSNKRLYVSGSIESLGKWDLSKAVVAQRLDTYLWGVTLPVMESLTRFEYKYVVVDAGGVESPVWEQGDNRRWQPAVAYGRWGSQTIVWGGSLRMARPRPRWAGLAVPLFSLRSSKSWGVGDFRDLKDMATWASGVGMKFLQILPINDTTSDGSWRDSYPYNARSVFALHPIYLDPVPWSDEPFYAEYARRGAQLEALPEMDYEAAMRLKFDFLDALYAHCGRSIIRRKDFREFCSDNDYWLSPYSRTCSSQALYGRRRSEHFFQFVQYLLHRQLQDVHRHFRQLRVVLKGDIPIGVSPDSVSAQTLPRLFHLDASAGAPPDDFAADGQNWGFPTYDWERMAEDGYDWWRRRLSHLGRYFDALRIDHVLGFFRIWEIPRHCVGGLMGHFSPAMPLTADELRQAGFTLPPAAFARPRLSAATLSLYGLSPAGADARYFNLEGGYYTLRQEYQTECQLLQPDIDDEKRIALARCQHEVLFIEDPRLPRHYHPRIRAHETQAYKNLPPEQRTAYDAIYEDYFYHRHDAMWAAGARRKFSALFPGDAPQATPLPCAEDLGMVPACVPPVLSQNGILSLEVRRMPGQYGLSVSRLADNPYLSVDTISTHDMPPLRLWWRTAHRQRAEVWSGLPTALATPDELAPEASAMIVGQHLSSPSMLCILALQDWLAVSSDTANPRPDEEQINQPADPRHRWRYRMHLTVEDLFAATPYNEQLRAMISQSGR